MELRLDVLITQIVGFLIVLWILKRYAWKPVLGMLEARRQRIADEIAANRRGEYTVPTWVLGLGLALMLAVICGFLLFY